ncbi:MAG: hypothetical protein SFU53_04815 [Terrimicrobiaceae bacterium]|nr:hypothetical protein [Terrimicrobiaceae bacterium]
MREEIPSVPESSRILPFSPASGTEPRRERLESLRRLVAEKFPESTADLAAVPQESSTGLPAGLLTEIHGSSGSVGLFVLAELERQSQIFAGFIDSSNAFDPTECPSSVLRRLLWVRCASAIQAVQSTDLLLRDGNLSLLVLDLHGTPAHELRRIPASTWHRFQRLLEENPITLALCTPRPCIAAARLRIATSGSWSLRDLIQPRAELHARLCNRPLPRSHLGEPAQRIA